MSTKVIKADAAQLKLIANLIINMGNDLGYEPHEILILAGEVSKMFLADFKVDFDVEKKD